MASDSPPLTARSVLLSLLLGNAPPRAPVAQLVRTTGLFGLAEGTTRTALSRMAAAGEVAADDGWYELTSPRLLARQVRQAESRAGIRRTWDGRTWIQAVVVTEGRRPADERARRRDELRRERLAELRDGVWMRPDNLSQRTGTGVDDGAVLWASVRPDVDQRALAARLWALGDWAARAERLRTQMADLLGPLLDRDHRALADGFVTSAAALRHFQADPLLPASLLPDGWPGDPLRDEYGRYDDAYRACLATYFRDG